MKFGAECEFEGELNITFTGGMESILNLGSSVASSQIASMATSMVRLSCDVTMTSFKGNLMLPVPDV